MVTFLELSFARVSPLSSLPCGLYTESWSGDFKREEVGQKEGMKQRRVVGRESRIHKALKVKITHNTAVADAPLSVRVQETQ